MPPPQLVPVGQVAADVLVLRDALAVFGVGRAPEAQRVDVEVLAIEVDALLGQELVDVFGEPLSAAGSPRFSRRMPSSSARVRRS